MGKNSVWVTILFILIAVTGFYLFQQKDVFKQSPFKSEFLFEDLTNAIVDDDGNLYVIDEAKTRINKLSRSNTILFKVDEKIANDSLYEYAEMIIDQRGELYVLKVEFLPYSDDIQSESILRYHADGSFDQVLYSIDHLEQGITNRTVRALQIEKDQLRFLTYVDGEEISLHSIDINSEEMETKFVSNPLEQDHVYEIVGKTPETIAYSTKQGELYSLEQGNSINLLPNQSGEIGSGVPEHLYSGLKNDLYFFDHHQNEIARIMLEDLSKSVFLNRETIETQGYSFSLADVTNISMSLDNLLIITQPNRVTILDQTGQVESIHEGGVYSREYILFQWWIWILPILFMAISFFAMRFIYIHMMNRRTFLVLKQVFLFASLVAVAMGLFSILIYHSFTNKLEEGVMEKLTVIANLTGEAIDGQNLQEITSPQDYMNRDYLSISSHAKGLTNGLNIQMYKLMHGDLYTILEGSKPIFSQASMTPNRQEIVEGRQIESTINDSSMVVIRPIYGASGKIVGLFEVVENEHMLNKKKDEFLSTIYQSMSLIGSVALILFLIVTLYILYPIRILSESVSEIAKGKWEAAATIHSNDEVALLSERVGQMSEYVRNFIEKMTKLNRAYYRFVPQQFLQYLGKETVLDLQLGDQTEQEKTVFVLKMRSFFSYSKGLTPEENFAFINFFLSRFSPIIQRNGGLINRYMGAGALSFFSIDSKHALLSAVEMRNELEAFNMELEKKGYPPIDIGMGIHKGTIMLGVIGEKERLEGAAISDHVNVTEVVESLSESLGTPILVTEGVIDDLKETKELQYRDLGIVNVSERDEPIHLYDVFQGDIEPIFKLKEETKSLFESGVIMYQDGRFFDARTNFIEVIKRNPYDKTAKLYFYLCDEYYQTGTPKNWDGTLIIN